MIKCASYYVTKGVSRVKTRTETLQIQKWGSFYFSLLQVRFLQLLWQTALISLISAKKIKWKLTIFISVWLTVAKAH